MRGGVEDMLARPPNAVLAWVEETLDAAALETGFHWQGLAYAAHRTACDADADAAARLRWAAVSIRVRERLAQLTGDADFLRDAMRTRVDMILRHGHVSGDPVRDSAQVVAWFHANRDLTANEAARLARNWPDQPIGTIRKLRRLKNDLNVVESLTRSTPQAQASLRPWLHLKDALP